MWFRNELSSLAEVSLCLLKMSGISILPTRKQSVWLARTLYSFHVRTGSLRGPIRHCWYIESWTTKIWEFDTQQTFWLSGPHCDLSSWHKNHSNRRKHDSWVKLTNTQLYIAPRLEHVELYIHSHRPSWRIKLTLQQAMTAQTGNRGTVLLFLYPRR